MEFNTENIAYMAQKLDKILKNCILCPHECRINRKNGQTGFCKAGNSPVISSALAHHGEEPPISGTFGSGTIFFTYCNMACVYCQNYQISQEHAGNPFTAEQLGQEMLKLQRAGCHNINLVSPTIWIPQIAAAFLNAKKSGLFLPLVYNTGGYDRQQTIRLLKGMIDIYMPDIRYSNDEMAEKYSGIKQYVKHNRQSIKEMYRQVGGLVLDKNGVAKRGLLIRLLVLPGNIAGIKETLDFIKDELSEDVYLSIMAQYHAEYKAFMYPELARGVTAKEYFEVVDYAEKLDLINGWTQDHVPVKEDPFRPDFNTKKVFKYYKDNKSERN